MYTDQFGVSVLTVISCRKKLLWWGLGNIVDYGNISKLLGVNLISWPLRIVVVASSLGPMSCLAWSITYLSHMIMEKSSWHWHGSFLPNVYLSYCWKMLSRLPGDKIIINLNQLRIQKDDLATVVQWLVQQWPECYGVTKHFLFGFQAHATDRIYTWQHYRSKKRFLKSLY